MNNEGYKANFLWPHEEGSVEEAGYEFANARTELYREFWWNELLRRKQPDRVLVGSCEDCGKKLYTGDRAVTLEGGEVLVCGECLDGS